MKPIRLRLRPRFIISVLLAAGVVTALLAGMTYYRTSDALLSARKDALRELASAKSAELARRLTRVERCAQDLSTTLEAFQPKREETMVTLMRGYLKNAPSIYALAVAYEPFRFTPGRRLFGFYMRRSPKGLETTQLGSASRGASKEGDWILAPVTQTSSVEQTAVQDYPRRDWYLLPLLLAKPVWIQPYFGETGQVLMTSYSCPIMENGKVVGVVSADVSLKRLGREVSRLKVGDEGYAFVVTHQGTFVAAPSQEWVMRESIFSVAEEQHRPDLRALGRRMISGEAGLLRIKDWLSGQNSWLAFTPVKGAGWSYGAMVPEDEVLAPVIELAQWQAYMALGGGVVLALVLWILIMGLTKPLQNLVEGTNRLAAGDLSAKVHGVPPGDEVGDVAHSFNTMVDELNRYIGELTETTAAKERIESELDLARQIQMSILPRTYPPFPDRPEFDLFARTIPARQVGGDFYDFFELEGGLLGLVVGDVSGKGVPAALFMTVSRTLIKNAAGHHITPMKTMNEVNDQIIPDNDMCMFVTVFYGVYDPASGKLDYVSAGHPAPLIRRNSGQVERLDQASGAAVGIMEDLHLIAGSDTLAPGEVVLVFTDGLDEAINSQEEMFGVARGMDWLAQTQIDKAPKMIDRLLEHHQKFTGDVEQFDDLTLLLFRRTA